MKQMCSRRHSWLGLLLGLLVTAQAVPVASAQTGNSAETLEAAKTKLVFARSKSPVSVERVVSQADGRRVTVQVKKADDGYNVTASVSNGPVFRTADGEGLIEDVYVGDLNSDGSADLIVTARKEDRSLAVRAVALRESRWDSILESRDMPGARLHINDNELIAITPEEDGRELHQFFIYSDEEERYHDYYSMIVPGQGAATDVGAASDAGINSAEEAALHMTAFNEGAMTPWNGPNQPYNSADPRGYKYGMASTNFDGALLSYGIKQWNFWSNTLPTLLRQMEAIDSTAFWNAFSGLDTTTFQAEVMSTSTTHARAYEWARLRVPGGTWKNPSSGASCTGFSTSTNCRWVGGDMAADWKAAFSRLGDVAKFQAQQRKNSYQNYIQPIINDEYTTVKDNTNVESLRAFAVLEDIGNQWGTGYVNSGPCSLDNWIAGGTTCSRANYEGVSRIYNSSLSDHDNVKNMQFYLIPQTYPRQRAIAYGDGTVTVNGVKPSWDSYMSGYGVNMNSTASFGGIPYWVTSLSVSPSSATINPGAGTQLTANASFADGTSGSVAATWSSSNTAVATVSSGGYVTGVSSGTAIITARHGGKSATSTITVGCSAGADFGCAITLSGSTTGSVGYQENKYYKFYAYSGTSYTVTLTPSSGDPDLYVYNPSQGFIDSSTQGSGSADTVTFTASSTGYHYIKVYGYSAASYSLSAASSGCAPGTGFDCAITISGSTSGSVAHQENKYYRFYAYSGTSYTVTLTPSSGDPDLSVYNPSQGYIGGSGLGAGSTDSVTFTPSSTGYHYIKVYGYSAANYTVGYATGGGGGCSDGSSYSCAISLGSSASSSVSQGQTKYYTFYAYSGSTYTVNLTPSSGDPDLYVDSPSQQNIDSSRLGTGSVDTVTFTASTTGYHYVRVYGYSAASYTVSR